MIALGDKEWRISPTFILWELSNSEIQVIFPVVHLPYKTPACTVLMGGPCLPLQHFLGVQKVSDGEMILGQKGIWIN